MPANKSVIHVIHNDNTIKELRWYNKYNGSIIPVDMDNDFKQDYLNI